jgi:hypothetical protein
MRGCGLNRPTEAATHRVWQTAPARPGDPTAGACSREQMKDDPARGAAKIHRCYTRRGCGPLFRRTIPSVNPWRVGVRGSALTAEAAGTSTRREGVHVAHAPVSRER